MKISTKKAHFDEPLHLESGRILSEFDLAYETYGELNAEKSNAIIVCHALTGSHHAAGKYENDRKPGWWDAVIGNGKAIDTSKFFVICVNILGSSFGSTNPMSVEPSTKSQYRLRFPVLVISDVVRAQMRLFERLGIKEAHAVIGGSLGGMQTLCFAIEFPNFTKRSIILASTYATKPWAIAFNSIAIQGIINDPEFKNGYYDEKEIAKNGLNGMALGRMAGLISFLTPAAMEKKFARNYVETDGLYELLGRYEVDRYMAYNGSNFSHNFDPLSYLYVAKMMNNFDCTRHYDSLENALKMVKSKITLISFSSDILFPPNLMKEMRDALENIKKPVDYFEVESDFGHDAFLIEPEKITNLIKGAING